ncbi:translation elongation factor 4 [Spiroplasma endosymbiont of Amphibalanus improvisus]|uniref:translation elongation factor 4 n=1 Tax=Spiroplasma endosymbiont of Amphibalanus improvisus TaxID=3066327 RepID=UPI00313C5FFB
MQKSHIRNFSIIAHIDHGKSTLADRILELTESVTQRESKEQMLDTMDLERERGITIKLNAVQIKYHAKNGEEYLFNLIDTPGHVDFAYEVSRSLAACEGAILVVDASQGIEAQTLSNVFLAMDNNIVIIPVINKIDLPTAEPNLVIENIKNQIGLDVEGVPLISAKTGLNVQDVLEQVVAKIPAPNANDDLPLRALIFDSYFDRYRGVMLFIRVVDGSIKVGDHIKFISNNIEHEIIELGIKSPFEIKKEILYSGEVGWISGSIKNIQDVNIGDTITHRQNQNVPLLPGYKKMNPMVYCGLYPIDSSNYKNLKTALLKIQLSDSSLVFELESSQALGNGFRCGFLGMLHMEVIQERLEREYNLEIIATVPSVIYKVYLTNGKNLDIENPALLPEIQKVAHIEEPFVHITITTPEEYVGPLMELCHQKRGVYLTMDQMDKMRVILEYELPLSEIIFNFFDKLKSISKGYATFDYEYSNYKTSKLVKMDIMLNGEIVDALSVIIFKEFAQSRGRILCNNLKNIIPRQNFEIPIQAAINKKIIARETIKALRKNVISKCYGGDISRKKKLLQKQKEGKKRMKAIGSVEVPQKAFLSILKLDD